MKGPFRGPPLHLPPPHQRPPRFHPDYAPMLGPGTPLCSVCMCVRMHPCLALVRRCSEYAYPYALMCVCRFSDDVNYDVRMCTPPPPS